MAKLKVNVCEECGRKFPTRFESQKYCSKKCRMESKKKRNSEFGQICWNCQNACGGCSWSQGFQPVENWIAEPYYIKEDNQYSYDIKYCPEFIHD